VAAWKKTFVRLVTARVQAEQFDIQHVGKPGQGCQFDIAVAEKAQATFSPSPPLHAGVIGYIARIIEW